MNLKYHLYWISIRFPWLLERSFDDVVQLISIADWQHSDRQKQRTWLQLELERLSRDLGWRKATLGGKRRWVNEFNWHLTRERGAGAPFGNTNRGPRKEYKYGIPRRNFSIWKLIKNQLSVETWKKLWDWARGRYLAPPLSALEQALNILKGQLQ